MTTALAGNEIAQLIKQALPQSAIESGKAWVVLPADDLVKAVQYLKESEGFDYLNDLTSVDYQDHFEVVYRLSSLGKNTMLVLKVLCYEYSNPVLPSITALYRGADLMEREIYDLMGIRFSGHPNLERLFLWDGFQGHPLRKDYL
jgi:NADH:ubiquinone oxidoreductase subunit C